MKFLWQDAYKEMGYYFGSLVFTCGSRGYILLVECPGDIGHLLERDRKHADFYSGVSPSYKITGIEP